MAQSYKPMFVPSTPAKESLFGAEKHLKVEDIQEAYIEEKDRLVHAIDSTKSVLTDLRSFNKEEWIVRYPRLCDLPRDQPPSSQTRKQMRRSLSFADDPSSQTEVVFPPAGNKMIRAVTLSSIPDAQNDEEVNAEKDTSDGESLIPSPSEFNILRLDLKLGHSSSSDFSASLVSQLEKSSIAKLIDERIGTAIHHIDKLRLRVEDTSSKVLVTGDLNSGKSTFVNALLRREVMPVDQQPCTTAFCEVHDATDNDGKEEIHIIKEGITYSINDESTFTRAPISSLDEIVSDNGDTQPMLKIYLADTRAPSESLLNNGVVDISLIDAPGLNRDSLKTTALFARQEEIDVVVFVVSAENHFTLSAKEFLFNASNEKAYLFIVVNKFEQIKNKEKCRKMVLEQIKDLSPRTYEDASDLVHFVDSASALRPYTANPAFDDLESSLRSFVLVKRSKSKLQPVSTYLLNLLSDVELLVGSNAIVAQSELSRAEDDLHRARPVLEKMRAGREIMELNLENVEEEAVDKTNVRTKELLISALDRVGQGKIAIDKTSIRLPSYAGILHLWDYARDVRRALLASLDAAVKMAEDEARVTTSTGVDKVFRLADEHLPEGVERSHRVFMPEAMFTGAKKASRSHRRRSIGGAVVAGGVHGLGIGLAHRSDLLETSVLDLFDFQYQFLVHFGESKKTVGEEEESGSTVLSIVSVGIGALTMVGGKAFGARGLIEGILRVSEIFANESTRKWVAPVVGAIAMGATAYFILELPNSIPRTIGRRIQSTLVRSDGGVTESELFVHGHVGRISRETRKVLRLASWDLRERFRAAMDESVREVNSAENMERKAKKALEYFNDVDKKTREIKVNARLTCRS